MGVKLLVKENYSRHVMAILKIMKKAGLSLRVRGWGFPLTTMNVVTGYFHEKIEET